MLGGEQYSRSYNDEISPSLRPSTPPQPLFDEYAAPLSPLRPNSSAQLPRWAWGGTIRGAYAEIVQTYVSIGYHSLDGGNWCRFRSARVAFKCSWTDPLFGAQLSIERKVVALTKVLQVPYMRALVDVRAALHLHTRRTLMSVAVRPMLECGWDVKRKRCSRQRIPIAKRVQVELFGRFQLSEARFGTGNYCNVCWVMVTLFFKWIMSIWDWVNPVIAKYPNDQINWKLWPIISSTGRIQLVVGLQCTTNSTLEYNIHNWLVKSWVASGCKVINARIWNLPRSLMF